MDYWLTKFKYNPIKSLINSENDTIIYFAKRDLLEKKVEPINRLWNLSEVQKLLKKQLEDGSWPVIAKKDKSF